MSVNEVDFDLLADAVPEIHEHLEELERDLHVLVQTPESIDRLASAFRHMHSIKGDFAYCHAEPIAHYVHALENVLQAMRNRAFQCSALVAEALLQGMDQIHGMLDILLQQHDFMPVEPALVALIGRLAGAAGQAAADQVARHILLALHGQWQPEAMLFAAAPGDQVRLARLLGEQLAAALALRRPDWQGRAAFQCSLVESLNQQYSAPVAGDALRLATLWHDVGLLAGPDAALSAHPRSAADQADAGAFAAHAELAARWLLAAAPDCVEAAQIIRQHHAWANGKGPAAVPSPQPLHPGAQMLACADLCFERIKTLRGDDLRRGLLRALFDVHGLLDSQFDPWLVNAFDAVGRAGVFEGQDRAG